MSKIDLNILRFIKALFIPAIIIFYYVAYQEKKNQIISQANINWYEQVVFFVMLFWFLILGYIIVKSLINKKYREQISLNLFKIEERDERELFASAQTARFSTFTTFAFALFIFFVSTFSLGVSATKINVETGKRSYEFAIKMSLDTILDSFIDSEVIDNNVQDKIEREFQFEIKYPLKIQDAMIFLILIQMISYRIYLKLALA